MRTDPKPRSDGAFDAAAPGPAPDGGSLLTGLGVSPGISIGPAHVVDAGFVQVPEYVILPDERENEQARFHTAVAKAVKQLSKLKAKTAALPDAAAEEIAYLLDAHLSILSGSRLIRGVERRIRDQLANAEGAVHAEMTEIAQQFEAMDDPYLASRIQDIREVGNRLLRNLAQKKYKAFSGLEAGSIVIAEEITPADTALMDPGRIAGFATMLGGAEGHTAIMARSLGIPAVLGVAGLLKGVRSGQTVIVDGTVGRVVVDPHEATLADYHARRAELEADREQLRTLISLPAQTRDGTAVPLMANLELPREVAGALAIGADGVGLLRTEFLFMNRDDLPDEEEQYDILRGIVEGMAGRPVTMRTLDVGGEKLASALGDAVGGGPNPALGLRAIRLSLKRPELLEAQLAAMLRAGGARTGAPAAADDRLGLGGAGGAHRAGPGGRSPEVRRRADRRSTTASRRDDRDPGRRAGRRRAGGCGRFLRDRDQRPDHVHAGDRPRRRAGSRPLRSAAPGGPATDPDGGGGGPGRAHPDQRVRRDGRRPALYGAAPGPRHPRAVDGAGGPAAGEAAAARARHRRRRAPRRGGAAPDRPGPDRRPDRRLQRGAVARRCSGAAPPLVHGWLEAPARPHHRSAPTASATCA